MPTAHIFGHLIKEKRKSLRLTQEDLCGQTKMSVEVTTLRAMENNPGKRFRFDKIKAIANVLELSVDTLVKPEVHSFVTVGQPRRVDFRCMGDPGENKNWRDSRVVVSLLPAHFRIDSACPETVVLEKASLTIPAFREKERFDVFYHVALNPAGSGWLGCVNDFRPLKLEPDDIHEAEYMFRSDSPLAADWATFVDFIKHYDEPLMEIDVRYEFAHDYHDIALEFSVMHMQELLAQGFKNEHKHPRYMQPRVQRMENKIIV